MQVCCLCIFRSPVLEDALVREKRAATGKKDRLWEHAVIPYTIDANFSGMHNFVLSFLSYLISQ